MTDRELMQQTLYALKPSESKPYLFKTPPTPNWRFYFGDKVVNNIQWTVYIENPPNKFQRWLCYKAFRLTWEQIK